MLLHFGCYLSSEKADKGSICLYQPRHTQKSRLAPDIFDIVAHSYQLAWGLRFY